MLASILLVIHGFPPAHVQRINSTILTGYTGCSKTQHAMRSYTKLLPHGAHDRNRGVARNSFWVSIFFYCTILQSYILAV